MLSLKDAAQKEGIGVPISLRSFMQEYGTNSLKTLFVGMAVHQGEFTSVGLTGGYQLTKVESRLQIAKNGVEITSVQVPTDKLNAEQSKQVVQESGKGIFKFFQQNFDGIASGNIKAADIGGAAYGITAAAVLVVLAPFAAVDTLLGQVFNFGFTAAAGQVGRYYGSIVDDFVAIVKGEDQPTMSQIVGTMSTLFFTLIAPSGGVAGAVRFLGADGWSLTKEVGKAVGTVLEDAIDSIETVVSDIGDALGDAVEFVEDIF
jgi:tetrahydromethanopterin S-methyltransferase subunit F